MRRITKALFACWLLIWLPTAAIAETITMPFGTTVFCELDQRVTSKKKETSEGDIVKAHVWKDVVVSGQVIVKAGTPVYVQVSRVKKARLAGRKGQLELEALNVVAIGGEDVPLSGGYDKSGKGRMGLSIALAAVVAWPLIFLKGKNAILEPGTIFDAIVRSPIQVELPRAASAPRPLRVDGERLFAEVLYDELDPDSKIIHLPLRLESSSSIDHAQITSVNGTHIPSLPIALETTGSSEVRGTVVFKALSKHFRRGMNRFEITVGELQTELLLEIEL